MGSPAINLVEVGVRHEPTAVGVGDEVWPLAPEQGDGLTGRDTAVLGLRPNAFRWPVPPDGPTVTVAALGVESLGDERHVLFQALGPVPGATDTAESLWTARVGADCHVAIGDQITLGVDLSQAYFFDSTTGLAVPA